MKPIHIFCPHYIRTGGPEALHQLSDALLEQGLEARLVYFNEADISGVGEENGRRVPWLGIPKQFPDYGCSFEEYGAYKANRVRSLDCSAPCVVVLPETLAHMVRLFPDHVTVLIWWLSVDNAFGALSHVNLNHLRKPNVLHAPQSEYAARVLDALGLISAGPLSDYTVDLTRYAAPLPWAERPSLVAFNTNHKVTADWPGVITELSKRDPAIECVPVGGSRADMAALFARARVYVDLGSFPGKDRMPREATTMGCIPLVSAAGASAETGAFVLGSTDPGDVADHVLMHMKGKPQFFSAPEREIFFGEARAVFSALC